MWALKQEHTGQDDGDVCFAFCWTFVNAALFLEIDSPALLCSFTILYLELKNAVGLIRTWAVSYPDSTCDFDSMNIPV